ncbi:MAG: hypothetical protein H0A76_06770 [Candidatus Thiodubiliella endoseptemdiera]|uniref:Uncharacterized protein n=1 Tax=Candidatus Thiodubiliella endoseptemdiera TaxID=2738886 RepID=A0A853F105_9GAMM|nr:hypothetical protein [Candidatus Thiodubiliella endoseptemdiera]
MQEHRTNGHKVVVIDWDDTHFYGIDNVGQFTLVLDFKKICFGGYLLKFISCL